MRFVQPSSCGVCCDAAKSVGLAEHRQHSCVEERGVRPMDEAAFERQMQILLTHRAPPLSGWVLNMALKADEDTGYPVVVRLHRATDFRRSVVIAVLNCLSLEQIRTAFDTVDLHAAMHALFHANIRAVLRKAFGPVSGLATALAKMDGEPLDDPTHYTVLLNLLRPSADPVSRKRAMTLRHAKNITSGTVCALEQVEETLVHPLLVDLFDTEGSALTANSILRYVQTVSSTPVTQDDVLAVTKGMSTLIFNVWAEKLMSRKADRLPAAPLDDHPDFVALKDATQFARLAHEYRNCLDTHVVRAATGRAAFYIPKQSPGLIVELLRHSYAGKDLWVLKGIHARGNARVGRRDRQNIEALLRLRGITPLDMGHAAGLSDKLVKVLSMDVDFHDNY
jgi:hypothetical protein